MKHLSHTPSSGYPVPGLTTTGQFRAVRTLEAALSSREAILAAVAFAATRFLDEPDWESNVRDVLERLGTSADVSRVYLFEMFCDTEGVLRISQRYEWAAPGITAEIGNPALQNLDLAAAGLGRWGETLARGDAIHGVVAELPEGERKILDEQDILSIALVPVIASEECWGFLGFDDCLTSREWGTELDALRAAAGMLGAALTRRRNDRRTSAQYAVARMLNETTIEEGLPPGIVETICRHFECRGGHVWLASEPNRTLSCGERWSEKEAEVDSTGDAMAPSELVLECAAKAKVIVVGSGKNLGPHAPVSAAFPIKAGAAVFGVIELTDPASAPRDDGLCRALTTIGGALGQFLERQRAAQRARTEEMERRRGEEELRESEERFRRLSEASIEGIVIHDRGVVLDVSNRFATMFGYDVEELVGRNVLDFLPAPDWKEVILERVRSGSEQPYEMVGIRKDGTRVSVEIHARKAVYHGRQVRVAAVRDITERKLLEQQTMRLMQEQAARAAAEIAGRRAELLAEASRVLGTSFDYETTLETLAHLAVPRLADFCTVDMADTDGVYRRLGVAHAVDGGEALLRRLDHFSPEDLSERHPLIRVLTTGQPVLVREIKEGALDQLGMPPERLETLKQLDPRSLVCVPLVASGRVIGAVTLVSTVSGRLFDSDDLAMAEELARRAGLAVENARLFREAQAATAARDEMLGIVAHDLRNPLNTIMMASDIMMELPATAPISEGRRTIEMVRRAADRMNRLIQDLLDVKRIESGRLVVEPRPQSVASVVTEAMEMLRPLATGNSLTLCAEVPADLPQAQIDSPRIHQVLSNLVGNSIKFTPAGGTITLRAEAFGDEVRISVIDTGPGIAPEQLPHLFGRYWQGAAGDRRGIGLGLAIAKGIVEAHKGRIWVESAVGQGSRFHFTVPISR
jgi:PAS domain S-box-containing protein